MVIIAGSTFDPGMLMDDYPSGSIQQEIFVVISSSDATYVYDSAAQLKFELDMRKAIVSASRDLYHSGLRFRTFRESMCNEQYWERTNEGGFQSREGVPASDAMNNIFRNGSRYGTECATAIIIVFYKGTLDVMGSERFNASFPAIYLMNWKKDQRLGVISYRNPSNFLAGDCRYFKNPDVNPLTPEWQGENAIDLSDGRYYGHGIGITTAGKIIDALNENRTADSTTSAYLMDTATRPGFKKIYNQSYIT